MKEMSLLIMLFTVFQGTVLFAQTDSTGIVEQAKSLNPEYSIAFEKMDAHQVFDAIRIIEDNKADIEKMNALFGNSSTISIIAPFIFIILVVLIVQLFRYKRKKDLNNLLTKYIEAGKEIPVELITNPVQPKNDLRRGLVWGCLGIAIVITGLTVNRNMLFVGLIPLFIGIAFTLSHFLIKKDENK